MYNMDEMICSFCVNDYHLAFVVIPYIYEAINEEKNIITIFDRDLDDMGQKVILTNEKFWRDKDIFQKVDLKKTRFDKLSEKFENVQDNDVVIVSGKDEFVERINRLLINFHTNFTIVNCFYIEDIAKNETFKISNYGKILNTKGLQEIEKYDLV